MRDKSEVGCLMPIKNAGGVQPWYCFCHSAKPGKIKKTRTKCHRVTYLGMEPVWYLQTLLPKLHLVYAVPGEIIHYHYETKILSRPLIYSVLFPIFMLHVSPDVS